MLTFVTLALAAPPIRVDAGVYRLDDREVWLGGYRLDASAGAAGSCDGGALPTVEERRVAARNPAFMPSTLFEELAMPSSEPCAYTGAVLEAEGIEGWLWFAGWGAHLGEAEVMSGQGDAREGVIRIHANPWHFWGDEAKPAPRGVRCVHRDPLSASTVTVGATGVLLRKERGAAAPVVAQVAPRNQVKEWFREGGWSWIEAPRSVSDNSGSEHAIRECTVFGWVPSASLVAP
ncbi:MAG: hypothetical protein EXR71_02815 [Myxococcales bacterium]|nr:hypothetical protein [Myxococcales bacterium]